MSVEQKILNLTGENRSRVKLSESFSIGDMDVVVSFDEKRLKDDVLTSVSPARFDVSQKEKFELLLNNFRVESDAGEWVDSFLELGGVNPESNLQRFKNSLEQNLFGTVDGGSGLVFLNTPLIARHSLQGMPMEYRSNRELVSAYIRQAIESVWRHEREHLYQIVDGTLEKSVRRDLPIGFALTVVYYSSFFAGGYCVNSQFLARWGNKALAELPKHLANIDPRLAEMLSNVLTNNPHMLAVTFSVSFAFVGTLLAYHCVDSKLVKFFSTPERSARLQQKHGKNLPYLFDVEIY